MKYEITLICAALIFAACALSELTTKAEFIEIVADEYCAKKELCGSADYAACFDRIVESCEINGDCETHPDGRELLEACIAEIDAMACDNRSTLAIDSCHELIHVGH